MKSWSPGSRRTAWLPLAALLAGLLAASSLRAETEDYLQRARERMEMRAWGDAFHFINLELKSNPRSWRALRLRGEYYQAGLGQVKEAISDYLRAYRCAVGREFLSGGEQNEFRSLCEELTRLVSERVAGAGDGGTRLLEQVVVENGFASLPLARSLLASYDRAGNWEGIKNAAAAIRKVPDGNVFKLSEKDAGWLYYYEGRALEETGDPNAAYPRYLTARQKGVTEANTLISKMSRQIEESAAVTLGQAKQAFDNQDYINAKSLYKKLTTQLPPGVPARDKAETGLADCESAIAIEAAIQAAEDAKRKGDFQTAMQRINEAMARYPSDKRLQKRFAELEKLRESFEKQAANQEDEKDRAARLKREERERLIMEGQELRKAGKYQEAGEKFQRSLKIFKDSAVEQLLKEVQKQYDVQDRYEQGVNLLKKSNYAGAAKHFEAVSEEDPDYKDTKKNLALCYFELQQFDKAQSLAEQYLNRTEDGDLLEKLAMQLESNKDSRVDMQKAATYWERLAKVRPADAERARGRVSALSWELNRFQYLSVGFIALVWFGAWIYTKKKPDWVKKINLVDLERFINKKDFRSAANLYPHVVKMSLTEKEELHARNLFARAFYECREYPKAISECQYVLRLLPENKQVRVLLARCLYATKNISPENLPFYMDFLESEPQNREVIFFIGTFCTKKQIINPMTMGVLRQLAALNPDDDKLRLLLVKGYLKENDRSGNAMALYQVERQKNPKNIDVRVIMAEEYLRKGDVTRAIQECEEIINIDLNEPRTHKVLADAYAKMGKTSELVAIYQSILEHDPHNGAIQNYLSRLLNAPPAATTAGAKKKLSPEEQKALFEQPSAGAQVAAGAAGEASAALAEPPVRGNISCPKCGKDVQVGTYFCTCGHPL